MTNEELITQTIVELKAIYEKLNNHIDGLTYKECRSIETSRIRFARNIVDTTLTILESTDKKTICGLELELHTIAESCGYFATEFED